MISITQTAFKLNESAGSKSRSEMIFENKIQFLYTSQSQF